MTTVIKLTEHVRRRIALEASVDPRTVGRYCRGAAIRGMAGERIEQALKQAGLLAPQEAPKSQAP